MEPDTLLDLPAHPLLVHLPVVLVPLTAIGALVVAVRPAWRRRFAVPVAVLAVVGALGVWLAAGSGEALEERVRETDQVEEHAEAGERAELPAAAFALLAVAVAVVDTVDRRRGRTVAGDPEPSGPAPTAAPTAASTTASTGATTGAAVASRRPTSTLAKAALPLAVVTVLVGGVASVAVFDAGHSGATAVWQDVADHPEPGSDAARESGGGAERDADEPADHDDGD